MNDGFDPIEIAELKKECEQENQNYVIVEDEDGMNDSDRKSTRLNSSHVD